MKKKLILPLVLLTLTGCVGTPTDKTPVTTPNPEALLQKQQWEEDYAFLVRLLTQVYPHGEMRRQLTGVDMPTELALLAQELDSIKTDFEFVALVQRALNLANDGHVALAPYEYALIEQAAQGSPYYAAVLENVSKDNFQRTKALADSLRPQVRLLLPLVYIGGEYYLAKKVSWQGKDIPRGARLTIVNGRAVHELVADLNRDIRLDWDFTRNRFFSASFYLAPSLRKSGVVDMTFTTPDGKAVSSQFVYSRPVLGGGIPPTIPREPEVIFLTQEETLYISIPAMDPGMEKFYTDRIKSYSQHKIEKVVIDIRGNPGGSDRVWMAVLAAILDEPFSIKLELGLRQSQLSADYLQSRLAGTSAQFRTIPFLQGEKFVVLKTMSDIHPSPDSINYSGSIYLLQDEKVFSAAGSLSAVASQTIRIVTVGTSLRGVGGRGLDPFLFSLPHSGIVVSIVATVDLWGAQNIKDLFHNYVDIPVELLIDDFFRMLDCEKGTRDRLIRCDPVFQEAVK